jgi:hypothetical protein
MGVTDFYLNNAMSHSEFIYITVEMIPVEFMDAYILWPLVDNGYIYAWVDIGMYCLPQARKITQERLTKVLEPFGYAPAPITAGLWVHKSRPITFMLVASRQFWSKIYRTRTCPALKGSPQIHLQDHN